MVTKTLTPPVILFLLAVQFVLGGLLAWLAPSKAVKLFGFTNPDAWQTPACSTLLNVLGVALVTLGMTAMASRGCSPDPQQRVARCYLICFIAGRVDCCFTHKISARRYSVGSILEDPTAVATAHAANVLFICLLGTLTNKGSQQSNSRSGRTAAMLSATLAAAFALALIPKPTHALLIGCLGLDSAFGAAEPRVVAIWIGFCFATVAAVGAVLVRTGPSSSRHAFVACCLGLTLATTIILLPHCSNDLPGLASTEESDAGCGLC